MRRESEQLIASDAGKTIVGILSWDSCHSLGFIYSLPVARNFLPLPSASQNSLPCVASQLHYTATRWEASRALTDTRKRQRMCKCGPSRIRKLDTTSHLLPSSFVLGGALRIRLGQIKKGTQYPSPLTIPLREDSRRETDVSLK